MKKRRVALFIASAVIVLGLLSFITISQTSQPEFQNVTVDGKEVKGKTVTLILDNEERNVTVYQLQLTRKQSHGKNQVSFPTNTKIKYARDLIDLYPEIEGIAYYDKGKKTSVGYISAFGGIGKNFKIKPNTVYEVGVSENLNLTLIR